MRIIPITRIMKGFFTFFLTLGGAFFINPIIDAVLNLVPDGSMWKIMMTIGWYLLALLIIVLVPIIVTLGPENLSNQVRQ